jgi:hypothetical protein
LAWYAGGVDDRLTLLRVCGLIDSLVENTEHLSQRYREFVSAIRAGGGSPEAVNRITRVLEWVERLHMLGLRARARVCGSDAGVSGLYEAYNDFERVYGFIVSDSRLLPASLRQLYYEIYRELRMLVSPSPGYGV